MANTTDGWLEINCLEVSQPIGTFYVGVLNSANLVRLAYRDISRIEGERRDVETYLGIERPLSHRRVGQLQDYVATVDATFPSSIILAVPSFDEEGTELAIYDSSEKVLRLADQEDIAKILDGQHRLVGLEGFQGEEPFEVIATIFVDIDLDSQAMIFATINLEQTKVNKSIAYDLYDYAKFPSPQKTGHDIVRFLDSREGSPFKDKLKILGTARSPEETISQATFIDSLLDLISWDAMKDRDLLKRVDRSKLPRAEGSQQRRYIFRNMFQEDRDADITRVLWNYFSAVQQRWGNYWTSSFLGNVLNRTTGFRGLMQFLRHAYLASVEAGEVPSKEQFDEIFSLVTLEGPDINPNNFQPGSTGQRQLRELLLNQTGLAR